MTGQRVIEVRGDALELGQAGPGHGGEVVVLVVQADVVGEPVEWAVVGEGLRDGDVVLRVLLLRSDGLVDIVFGDEVACKGVEAAGEEGGNEEVEDRFDRGREVDEGGVEADLDGDVKKVDLGQGDAVDGHGANGIEEDLEGAEEGFAENGVQKEGLQGSRQVRVEAIHAEALVMSKMVRLGGEEC